MTKEQIQKHGEVIKWFCDNPEKGVWYKATNGIWTRCPSAGFDQDGIYVQNDEYAELRKAQADGKIIQSNVYKERNCYSWSLANDWEGDCFEFIAPVQMYRIKPENVNFKVGDWVVALKEPYNTIIATRFEMMHVEGNFKLWEPKEGEWCCFYDDVAEGIRVEPFSDEDNGLYYCEYSGESFSNIAPLEFVQTLRKQNESR